jgi:Na+-transporting methylmalonyl-CoA/oxaloacetate decarboxylase gamma subunit
MIFIYLSLLIKVILMMSTNSSLINKNIKIARSDIIIEI